MKKGDLQDDENRKTKSTSRRKTRLKVEKCPCRGGATRSVRELLYCNYNEAKGGSFSLRQKTTGKLGEFDE